MLAAVVAMAAGATDYTGTLTVDGTASQATVHVTNSGSNYTVAISNVSSVGNITITAPGTTESGLTRVVTSQEIEAGQANLVLVFNQYAMGFNLDIVSDQGNTTNVKFAQDGETTGYQIKNSGFENYKSNGEPLAWHGFKSATGIFAGAAQGKLGSSTDKRPGSTGSKSAVITSGKFMVINNGTMTTGRLNAGSMSATNTANHSEMNMGSAETDANGDPFYTIMHGRPDAIKLWIKFSQASANTDNPYASLSAIITNGTYYQDPEDKTYTNKLATAKNTTITTCGWTEMTVPFEYINNTIDGKALLVTISTNATPGQGSSGDKVWIDDIAMVYNAAITGITVKGQALEGFLQDVYEYNFRLADGETIRESDINATFESSHAYLVKKVVDTDLATKVFVAVVSNDLNTIKVYTINYLKPMTLTDVMFTRERQWATWYGDMNLELPANVTASVVTGIKGNTVVLQSIGYIPAGVGVLLNSNTIANTVKAYQYSGATTSASSLLVGSNGKAEVSNAYLLYNNQFILAQENTTVPAHRCYLPVPSDMQNAPHVLMIGNQGTVTAIDDISTSDRKIDAIYNAQGQRVNENATGILIIRYTDGTTTKVIR